LSIRGGGGRKGPSILGQGRHPQTPVAHPLLTPNGGGGQQETLTVIGTETKSHKVGRLEMSWSAETWSHVKWTEKRYKITN